MRIPCDLHLLKSTRSESRPRAFQAHTRRLFAAIEAVIFQFLLMRAGRFLTDLKENKVLSIVEVISVLVRPV